MLAFTTSKSSQCAVIASPKLEQGKTYTVLTGGTCNGENTDGLCTDGTYEGGSEIAGFTVSGSVNTAGNGSRAVRWAVR